MSTLYVLDWYNRTYQSFHHPHPFPAYIHPDPTQQMPNRELPPEKIIELLNSSWIPPNQNAPALTINCPSAASLTSLIAGIICDCLLFLRPYIQIIQKGPLAPAANCPQYCCATENGANNYYQKVGKKISQGMDSLVALASKLPHVFPQRHANEEEDPNNADIQFGNGVKIEVFWKKYHKQLMI
jgi:hypothetical protein